MECRTFLIFIEHKHLGRLVFLITYRATDDRLQIFKWHFHTTYFSYATQQAIISQKTPSLNHAVVPIEYHKKPAWSRKHEKDKKSLFVSQSFQSMDFRSSHSRKKAREQPKKENEYDNGDNKNCWHLHERRRSNTIFS